jgi:hypothetical protein
MGPWLVAGLIGFLLILTGGPDGALAQSQPGGEPKPASPVDPAAKRKNQLLFRDVLFPVFSHARCTNCHGRVNMVTGANHAAGPAAQFSNCATSGCHTPKEGFPPAEWQVPPDSMSFAGKDAIAACATLKKHVNAEQFLLLVRTDELIHWAFNPGKGRVPAPGGYARFLGKGEEWAKGGSFCPE